MERIFSIKLILYIYYNNLNYIYITPKDNRMTRQISFPDEHTDAVTKLINKHATGYEHLVNTKDGIVYEITFASPAHCDNFTEEFNKLKSAM